MNDKYQIEIDEFSDRFAKYKDARIVLYGIGRYTATLLEGLKGFRFPQSLKLAIHLPVQFPIKRKCPADYRRNAGTGYQKNRRK